MRRGSQLAVLAVAVTVTAAACTPETTETPTTVVSTVTSAVPETQTSDPQPETPTPVLIPFTPAGAEPLTGRWIQTNLGLDGLLVIPRGLVWDGKYFYIMLRVAFGDVRVWRSLDALMWEELPSLGTVGTLDGPNTLLSHGDWLVAGGDRQGDATVWLYEGDRWREVSLGVSATVTDLTVAGRNLVAFGYSPHYSESSGGPVPLRHATIWVSADGVSWTEVAGSDLFGEHSQPVGVVPFGSRVLAVANRSEDVDGSMNRLTPLIVTSSNGSEWEQLPVDLGEVDLTNVTGGQGITVFSRDNIWQSPDGESWTRSIVDRSGIAESRLPQVGLFKGRVVATGGALGEDPTLGLVELPAAWTYLGDGEWSELGVISNPTGPGSIAAGIPGGDRYVANGQAATAGPVVGPYQDDGWALYTFVIELPVEDVLLTWVNQTGLGQVDPAIWTERLDGACAEGVWADDVAYRLAETFITDDLPFSLRDDGAIPLTGEAAQALWIMAVNYCRADFPSGEIADGAPTP